MDDIRLELACSTRGDHPVGWCSTHNRALITCKGQAEIPCPSCVVKDKRIRELERSAQLDRATVIGMKQDCRVYQSRLVASEARCAEAEGKGCGGKQRARYMGASDSQVNYRANADPRGILTEGDVYEVESIVEGDWHTDVHLVGHKGMRFNSVCFDIESGPCPHEAMMAGIAKYLEDVGFIVGGSAGKICYAEHFEYIYRAALAETKS